MKPIERLRSLGQSIWLDNLNRALLQDGTLRRYIEDLSVTGLTSNPTIFEHAIAETDAYDAAIWAKRRTGISGEALFFERSTVRIRRLLHGEFRTTAYPSLEAIVREFLDQPGRRAAAACFAVADPVVGDHARLTNVAWTVERDALARTLHMEPGAVTLLNDVEAVAVAIPALGPTELMTLASGQPEPHGCRNRTRHRSRRGIPYLCVGAPLSPARDPQSVRPPGRGGSGMNPRTGQVFCD